MLMLLIKCWNYKKQLQDHNLYEKSNLIAIDEESKQYTI